MSILKDLQREMRERPEGKFNPDYFRYQGYKNSKASDPSAVRADGIYALFTLPEPFIYQNDLIVGSIRPIFVDDVDEKEAEAAAEYGKKYPGRGFGQNGDHFAPDYFTAVELGIPGLIEKIEKSKIAHKDSESALIFLDSMKKTLVGLIEKFRAYAAKAEALKTAEGYDAARLDRIAENCLALTVGAPQTFEQGLQLVWMIHNCFVSEGKYAMALGRIDRFLYPLYEKDVKSGALDDDRATELVANTFAKICEHRYMGYDDVVNICIGGVDENGDDAVTGLTYCVLHAVRDVNMPGPNLSARVSHKNPDKFLDECLKVIGTGLGYPALMNDDVHIAALLRKGYELKDVRNFCMVGCIENFITGKQPPWVDGRFDPICFLLDVLHGFDAGTLDAFASMEVFMALYEKRLAEGAQKYAKWAHDVSDVPDPENHTMPFMSCFCDCCIDRALDINMGGAKYPSAHGAVLMGIGTVSDCLAAIEKTVFVDKSLTLSGIVTAIDHNFEGYENVRETLLAAPKYGNNDDFVDKYAVWYTRTLSDMFDQYKTHDDGPIYTAMAANTTNISAGQGLSATPDGRLAGRPLSDAASPTYGCDTRGVTSTLLSVSKPDYTRCACGTVVNQKFSPSAFTDGKRERLMQLIRVYFARGGQEIQINSTSREILKDAMEHPEKYPNLVVRVSGYSAIYVTLGRDIQEDILSRTQHETV
jgi:formate C-acetyltransferase